MKSGEKSPPHTTPSILAGHAKTPRPIILVRAWRNTLFRQKSAKNFRRPAAPANARRHPARRRPYRPGGAKAPRLRGARASPSPRRPPSTHKAYRPGLGGLPPRPAATAPARRRRRRRGCAPQAPRQALALTLTLTLTLNGKHSVTIAL